MSITEADYSQLKTDYEKSRDKIYSLEDEVKRLTDQLRTLKTQKPRQSSQSSQTSATSISSEDETSSVASSITNTAACDNIVDETDAETLELFRTAARKRSVLSKIIMALESGSEVPSFMADKAHRFELKDGLLFYANKLCVGNDHHLHKKLLQKHHDEREHHDEEQTMDQLKLHYYWPGMRVYTSKYIKACDRCSN